MSLAKKSVDNLFVSNKLSYPIEKRECALAQLVLVVCRRQILIVRFGVRILLVIRKVFGLDNSILIKIEIYLK